MQTMSYLDDLSFVVYTKGLAGAIVYVKPTTKNKMRVDFEFDLTNLSTPQETTLLFEDDRAQSIVFRPLELGEKIGIGLTLKSQTQSEFVKPQQYLQPKPQS